MPKKNKRSMQYVEEVEFAMKRGQSLVISLGMPKIGLERIIIENKSGAAHVQAHGRTRFEFSNIKAGANSCDFWLANPFSKILLEDYLTSCFWGQFNWSELFKYQGNKKLGQLVREHIKKLVEKFESRAARELNNLVGGRLKHLHR